MQAVKPCNNCQTKTSGPQNYLLTCCGCLRGFHHRCLHPPLSDSRMIELLNNLDPSGLAIWTCTRCIRKEEKRERGRSCTAPVVALHGRRDAGRIPMLDPSRRTATPEVIVLSDEEPEGDSAVKRSSSSIPLKRLASERLDVSSSLQHHIIPGAVRGSAMSTVISLLDDEDMDVDPPKPEAPIKNAASERRLPTPSASPQSVVSASRDWDLRSIQCKRKSSSRGSPPAPMVPDDSKLPLDGAEITPNPILLKPAHRARPRKLQARKLVRSKKTPSQRSFTMISAV